TSSAFVATCRRPWRSASAAARPEPLSVTRIRSAIAGSALTHPATIAGAMLPAPRRPRTGVEGVMEAGSVSSRPRLRALARPHGRNHRCANRGLTPFGAAAGLVRVEEAGLHQERLVLG